MAIIKPNNNTLSAITVLPAADGSALTGISSDFVLLSSTDITSSTASVTFDGHFSSTYQNYKVIISNLIPATNSARLRMRYRQSDADVTASNYAYVIGADLVYSAGSGAANLETSFNTGQVVVTSEMKNTSTLTNSVELTLFDPLSAQNKACTWHNQNFGSVLTDLNRNYIGSCLYDGNTTVLSGLTFYMDSGDISTGNFKLYGIK